MVKSLVNVDGSPAPPDPLARFAAFTMYMIFYLHPPQGPTPESIRRGVELWSYSFNNITDKKVERTHKLSYLPKMIEATKLMTKHGVHPGSPTFLALQGKALEEIKEGKLKVPTMLIWGYHDSMMHHEVGIELFKCIINSDTPGSRLVIFDNCDHFPFIEYPELFNRTIKSFCGAYTLKPVD
jgi:pimeloyl-ACP methyl ester carboxylesterase